MNQNLSHPYPLQVFVFGNDTRLGEEIANQKLLNVEIASNTHRIFSDGERLAYQQETVRDRDVFIILTSQNGADSDKWFMDYLRFVRAIKDGSPHKITVIIPKLPHQRQDVENRELRQPAMSGFFPDLFKEAGADRIVVCKLHNPASRTRIPPMENLDTTTEIIEYIRSKYPDLSRTAIGAGDLGGSKYCRKIASELRTPIVMVDKDRDPRTGETQAMEVYAKRDALEGIDTVIFVDDIISTFKTLKQAADAVHEEFNEIVNFHAIATHADFGEETMGNIVNSRFNTVSVTNTVPVSLDFVNEANKSGKSIEIISVAQLLANAIDNLHNGRSVSALWIKNNGNGHQKETPQTA